MPIENVSDTARWVAVYRAMETERPDALFRDPFAERLAGERGAQIVNEMKRGRSLAWPMIVRTAVFDEMIMDLVDRGVVDTVINLAAGLDARAWRLPLPASLRWFDVDLPAMTQYKADAMQGESPACVYRSIAADLTNPTERHDVLATLGAQSSSALVVTEGLLVYLAPQDVEALARDMHEVPSIHWWISDLASPRLLKIMNRYWGRALAAGKAPFLFGPEEGTAFFDPLGWREAQFRSGMEEARRLHREMRMMPLWRILMRFSSAARRESFRRMSAYIMLERRD